MKAVQFTTFGGPEVLQVVEVDEPHAGDGQVRIKVRAAGVNGIDWKIRAGHLQEQMPLDLPAGTGMDASGIVDEVGDGARGVEVGDAVFGSGTATLAEYAVLDSWARKPASLSFEEAAGFPVPVETAIRIIDQVGVQPGQILLISGATGGVGSAAVQIAKDRGIKVIGTASEKNQDYLASLGAAPTTYGRGLIDRVRTLAPAGVDAALDIAGSGVIPELVELTGDPAKVVSIADFTAPEHGAQVSAEPGDHAAAFAEAARLAEQGVLTLPVQQIYPFDQTAEAHIASADGHVTGRLIVTVS
jgi:NADPH:quinone reductase-like Zn-dependent oxidoreductase